MRARHPRRRPWLAWLALAAVGALILAPGANNAAAQPRVTLSDVSVVGPATNVAPFSGIVQQVDDLPQVAVNARGDAVAVWRSCCRGGIGDDTIVQAASRPAGGAWQAPVDLSARGGGNFNEVGPQVAIDPAGDAVAVWDVRWGSNSVVQAAVRPAGGGWQAPDDLAAFGDRLTGEAQVAMDSAGNAIAVWYRDSGATSAVQAAVRPAGGTWQTPVDLSTHDQWSPFPQLALDPAGDAVVVWRDTRNGAAIVRAASRRAGGAWQAPVDVSAASYAVDDPDVALDQAGNAVAVWSHRQADGDPSVVQAAVRPAGGAWQARTDLSAPGHVSNGAQVAMTPAGVAYAVWLDHSGPYVLRSRARAAGGAWQIPVDLSSSQQQCCPFPRLALDPAGDAIAVWDHSNGVNWTAQAAARSAYAVARFWQPPVDLSGPGPWQPWLNVALDQAGGAVAVFTSSDADGMNSMVQATSRQTANGAWQAPVQLSVAFTTLVPDVTGLSKRFAAPQITAAGLVPQFTGATTATVSYVATETPTPGTRVLLGSTVTLYLKPGSPP